MDHNAPPGPGWVQGPDGHWRPPSLFGPVGPPTAGPPSSWPTGPPPAAGPPPAPGTWPPPPPGPPAVSSGARTALAVVGGVVAVGVSLVVVALVAVTFLGTTAETPSATATTTGGPIGVGPDGIGDKGREAEVDPGELADAAADEIVRVMGDQRYAVDDRLELSVPASQDLWCSGESAQEIIAFDHPEVPANTVTALGVVIIDHESEAAADRSQERMASDAWRACSLDQYRARAPGHEVRYDLLPGEAAIPGIGYTVRIDGPDVRLATPTYLLSVGSLQAVVTGCECRPDAVRAGARQVAAILAEVQDLPVPG